MKNMRRILLISLLLLASLTHAQDTTHSPITAENAVQIEQLAVWDDMLFPPGNIAFADDLTGFVTYGDDQRLSLWSVQPDLTLKLLHKTPVTLSKVAGRNVVYQVDSTLHVWDLAAGVEIFTVDNAAQPTEAALSDDGALLAYATNEDTIEVWDIVTRERVSQNYLDGSTAQALSFISPSDDLLMQTHRNTGITLYIRFEQQGRNFFLQTPIQRFESILFSADKSRIFITESYYRSGEDGFVSITDVWDGFSAYQGAFEGGSLRFLPNGLLYSSTSVGGPSRETTITLRDPNTLDIRKTFVYGGAVKTSAHGWEFSPDGTRLVTMTWDYAQEGRSNSISKRAYTFWDVESGGIIATSEPIESVGIMAFSPDSKLLATENGQNIALWDTQTGELLATLTGHTDFVTKLVFSADGTRLVTSSNDGTIRVWGISNEE